MKIIKWFKNISISKKLYFVLAIMALLIAIELFVLWFSLNTLTSVRAFVTGEGLWSKAEKDAVYNLQKYARTFNEKDYLSFQKFMKVPEGDHKTLMELLKKEPDMNIARQGFLEGRNHPNDVDGMIKLFTRFHKISYIHKAIIVWSQADSTIALLPPIAKRLHAEINSEQPSEERIDTILKEVDYINQQLTILEDEFSFTLGEGSRWLEDLILKILFAIALTVELTGLILTISVSIGITKGINEIMRISTNVSNADFNDRAKIYSIDEIGLLAKSFNKMLDDLHENINERAHAEQNMRKQKELYESLIETQGEMGEGIAITENSSIVYANDTLSKLYGYSKDELFNLPSFIDIIVPEEKEKLQERLKQRLAGNESSDTGETIILRKDGKRLDIEYSIKMISSEGRTQYLSIIRDISSRKQAEEKLKQKTQELLRSNEELEQFAYVASHDLQEPLRIITSYVQLLEERYKDQLDDEAKEFIGFAVDGAKRMKNLIHSLLEYSRVNKIKPFERIITHDLLTSVLYNLKEKIKENNAVVTIETLPDINGDNILLWQLFQNLIENAIKFKNDQNPAIVITGKELEKEYLFSVKDNCIAIPKEYSEKIFVLFQRLHSIEKYPGTGIGLAICKKIVERHSGKIWVESELNMGNTFYFTIKK